MTEALARVAASVTALIQERDEYRDKLIRSERDLAEAEMRIDELEAPRLSKVLPPGLALPEKGSRVPYEVVRDRG